MLSVPTVSLLEFPIMLPVTIVNLQIRTGIFFNSSSFEKALTMAKGKELSNSQKAGRSA